MFIEISNVTTETSIANELGNIHSHRKQGLNIRTWIEYRFFYVKFCFDFPE